MTVGVHIVKINGVSKISFFDKADSYCRVQISSAQRKEMIKVIKNIFFF
jgi:hypothetical protein